MTDETNDVVRRFIDGEIAPEDEADALHRIADDPEARAMLRFERSLHERFDRPAEVAPPADFTDRVMAALPQTEHAAPSLSDRIRSSWEALWTPQAFSLRPAYGLAVATIAALAFSLVLLNELARDATDTDALRLADGHPATEVSSEEVLVRFAYAAEDASTVAVAGDFSNWEPITLSPHTVNGEKVWSSLVPLPRGEHRYMFVVDGTRWVSDPLASVHRQDGFGHRNAVIAI